MKEAFFRAAGVVCFLLAGLPVTGAVRTVAADGTGMYPTIQDAVAAAATGDTVVVGPGRYDETVDLLGKAIVLRSGDPTDPEVVAATVIAAGAGGTCLRCVSGETAATVIEGLTLTGGSGMPVPIGTGFEYSGGGMYNAGSSPTVRSCCFIGHTVRHYGGGMYNHAASPTVIDCTFIDNAAGCGGGMYQYAPPGQVSAPVVQDCLFLDNLAVDYGGGMGSSGADPTVTGCTFSGNRAACGGGMRNYRNARPVLTDCVFVDNAADYYGGGLYSSVGAAPTLNRCVITHNVSGYYGGGMYNNDADAIVACTIFSGNVAVYGGAMMNNSAAPLLTRCTFDGNSAVFGSVLRNDDSAVTVSGCILWGCGAEAIEDRDGATVVRYSCVQGGWAGEGNLQANPRFVQAGYWDGPVWVDGDYHLKSQYGRWQYDGWVSDAVTSACVDAGDAAETAWREELWPHGGRVNLGAYGGTAQASMSASAVGSVADLDGDAAIGTGDMALFCEAWLAERPLLKADMNRDGRVDLLDFVMLSGVWQP